jgi:hypothetical protein
MDARGMKPIFRSMTALVLLMLIGFAAGPLRAAGAAKEDCRPGGQDHAFQCMWDHEDFQGNMKAAPGVFHGVPQEGEVCPPQLLGCIVAHPVEQLGRADEVGEEDRDNTAGVAHVSRPRPLPRWTLGDSVKRICQRLDTYSSVQMTHGSAEARPAGRAQGAGPSDGRTTPSRVYPASPCVCSGPTPRQLPGPRGSGPRLWRRRLGRAQL